MKHIFIHQLEALRKLNNGIGELEDVLNCHFSDNDLIYSFEEFINVLSHFFFTKAELEDLESMDCEEELEIKYDTIMDILSDFIYLYDFGNKNPPNKYFIVTHLDDGTEATWPLKSPSDVYDVIDEYCHVIERHGSKCDIRFETGDPL